MIHLLALLGQAAAEVVEQVGDVIVEQASEIPEAVVEEPVQAVVEEASAMVVDPITLAVAVVVAAITFVLMKSSSSGEKKRYPVIIGMATGNPPYKCTQQEALAVAQKVPGIEKVQAVLPRIYGNSRIGTRHFAVPDFTPDRALPGDEMFFPADHSFKVPVETRLAKFKEVAVPLVTRIAREAIENANVAISDIHKLVVVSSTGFLGPGLDCELINQLGLARSVDRSLIGFMGCAAAMNGFRIANDYCKANAGKYALLVCVEISSVHTTFDDDINDSILHAIFADGCAAAVLSGETKDSIPKGTLAIVDDHAWLMEGTEDGITLSINENGISCTLSKYLPQYIAKNMAGYVDGFLGKHGIKRSEIDFWSVHPGGRRIIEEAQNGLGLTEEQTSDSWAVLDQFGNMLSPSVMFVLERVFKRHNAALAQGKKGYRQGLAFSFSPGVGAEGILLKQLD
jgi:alpha-pyrone synthase